MIADMLAGQPQTVTLSREAEAKALEVLKSLYQVGYDQQELPAEAYTGYLVLVLSSLGLRPANVPPFGTPDLLRRVISRGGAEE